MKTLYIRINSSLLPKTDDSLVVLDCNSINLFCNYVCFEMVEGMNSLEGVPYYKVFQVGNLLADFATIDKSAYLLILNQLEQMQCDLLRKIPEANTFFTLSMPVEYVDWLLHHENAFYSKVGEKLKMENHIQLSTVDLYSEIIPTICYQLKSYMQIHKDTIDCIVFSDDSIKRSSAIMADMQDAIAGIEFLRLHQWQNIKRMEIHKQEEIKKRHLKEIEQKCADQVFAINSVSFEMVYVKGGTFKMGSDSGWFNHTSPVHSVTLSDYYIGRFPVTQKLWEAIMGNENNISFPKGENLPVHNVSWINCNLFMERLSKMLRRNFQLPTEAQWEYAARGGIKSRGFKYSGSNNWKDVAWFNNERCIIQPVGKKLPNELGIYDMSGNISEWCSDWYENPYPYTDQSNPKGPSEGSYKVFRGGSFNSCWSVYDRYRTPPESIYDFIGFRLALPIDY